VKLTLDSPWTSTLRFPIEEPGTTVRDENEHDDDDFNVGDILTLISAFFLSSKVLMALSFSS
jgi:hypothetical protein